MDRITVILICLTLVFQSKGMRLERREVLADLDDGNLKQLDIGVRKELLFMIVEQINKTTVQQSALSTTCALEINATIDRCMNCNNDRCVPQPPPVYIAIAETLLSYAFAPEIATGELIKSIGESLKPAVLLLGSGAERFVNELGSVSKTIGNGFKDGAATVFNSVVSGFESIGDKFTDLGKTIGSGATDLVNGLGDRTQDLLSGLGSGFTGLTEQLQNSLNSLGSGITSIGNQLVDGVKNLGGSISNAFGHIFGKRCTQSCPTCDQLDVKAHSKEEILKSICGADTINKQQQAFQILNMLGSLYNATLQNHIVTKVEYDPTSIKTAGGISFATNYVTFTLNGKTIRFHSGSDLMITDISSTAKSIAHQIWEKI